MAKECAVCGKRRVSGNQVSHSHRKTKRTWGANLKKVKALTATGGTVNVYVCTRCMRSNNIERA